MTAHEGCRTDRVHVILLFEYRQLLRKQHGEGQLHHFRGLQLHRKERRVDPRAVAVMLYAKGREQQ